MISAPRIPSRFETACCGGRRKEFAVASLVSVVAVLVLSSCSAGQDREPDAAVDAPGSPTIAAPTTGESASTTAYSEPGETTSSPLEGVSGLDPYRTTIRLEGREGIRFGGDCAFGARSRRIEGTVPDRVTIHTGGSKLACRIEKNGDDEAGELRVVLTSDGRTRSVQQSDANRREVSVSYNPAVQGG